MYAIEIVCPNSNTSTYIWPWSKVRAIDAITGDPIDRAVDIDGDTIVIRAYEPPITSEPPKTSE